MSRFGFVLLLCRFAIISRTAQGSDMNTEYLWNGFLRSLLVLYGDILAVASALAAMTTKVLFDTPASPA